MARAKVCILVRHGCKFRSCLPAVFMIVASSMLLEGAIPSVARSSQRPRIEAIRLVKAPAGAVFDGPIWGYGRSAVVVSVDTGGGDVWDGYVGRLDLTSGRIAPLPLRRYRSCPYTFFGDFAPMASGEFAYVRTCYGNHQPPDMATTILAFNPKSGRSRSLRPYFLPWAVGTFSFSPVTDEGLVNDGNGLYERLARLAPGGLEYVHLPFTRVGYPSWAPDGEGFVLDAVPSRWICGRGGASTRRRTRGPMARST